MSTEDVAAALAGKPRPVLTSSMTFNKALDNERWKIEFEAGREERTITVTYDGDTLTVEMYQHRKYRQRGMAKVLDKFELALPETLALGRFTDVVVFEDDVFEDEDA